MIEEIDFTMRALAFELFKDTLDLQDESIDVALEPKETAVRQVSEKRGTEKLEMASVWKTSVNPALARQRTPVARRGISVPYTKSDGTDGVTIVKAVPIDMVYELTIWTKDLGRSQRAVQDMLWFKYQDPNVHVMIDDTFPMELDMVTHDIVDESRYAEKYGAGEAYVYSLRCVVEGWLFKREEERLIKRIVVKVYTAKESDEDKVPDIVIEHDCTEGCDV